MGKRIIFHIDVNSAYLSAQWEHSCSVLKSKFKKWLKSTLLSSLQISYYRKIYYFKLKLKSIDISGFQNYLSVENTDAPIRPIKLAIFLMKLFENLIGTSCRCAA